MPTKPMSISGDFLVRTLRAEFYKLPRDSRDFITAWAETTPDMTLEQLRALVHGEATLEGETPTVVYRNLQDRNSWTLGVSSD